MTNHDKTVGCRKDAVDQVAQLLYGDGGEAGGRRIAMRKCVDEPFAAEVDATFDLLTQMEELRDSEIVQSSLRRSRTKPKWRYFAMAASVILAVAASILMFPGTTEPESVDRYVTRVGEQKQIELDDGTQIHLNTNSELLVVKQKNAREVVLRRGEAFFSVQKDPSNPLVVDAGEREVTVLGTAFNIFKEVDQLTVTVTEGEVAVHKPGEGVLPALREKSLEAGSVQSKGYQQWRIVPGQTLAVNLANKSEVLQVSTNKPSWINGQLTFYQTPLYLIIKELNRYSVRKILVEDESIISQKITAAVDVRNLSVFLSGLEYSQGIRVVTHPDRIVLVAK